MVLLREELQGSIPRALLALGNPTLTLTAASVDIGPCHFTSWPEFLPATAGPAVINLTFSNGVSLTVTDSAEALTTGGVDRFACSGLEEAAPWQAVAAADIERVG